MQHWSLPSVGLTEVMADTEIVPYYCIYGLQVLQVALLSSRNLGVASNVALLYISSCNLGVLLRRRMQRLRSRLGIGVTV